MQKMIIVEGCYLNNSRYSEFHGLAELNAHLADGWKVVNMQVTDITEQNSNACYVVIEKE